MTIAFDEPFLRQLERLRLLTRRPREGMRKGDRPSTRRGTSVEFIDFRPYTTGDDPRQIDWHAYARLDRPFVRLYREEEDVAVHLLIDNSASMDFGQPPKLEQARRLGAALGYIALLSGDPVRVGVIAGDRVEPMAGGRTLRGRSSARPLFTWLDERPVAPVADLNRALARYARAANQAGLAIVVSDLMTEDGGRAGLDALLSKGFDLAVIQVLAHEELAPAWSGDLRLVDVESGAGVELTLNAETVRAYQRALEDWLEQIQATCRARGGRYVRVTADTPLPDIALRALRAAGILD